MTYRDDIAQKMATTPWHYAKQASDTCSLLHDRIREGACSPSGMITYSDLVKGVTFTLPNVRQGLPFVINIHDWSDFERGLVGDFLGYICSRTYQQWGIYSSAIVVSQEDYRPSVHFFRWMRELGALKENEDEDTFWVRELTKAQAHYQANP